MSSQSPAAFPEPRLSGLFWAAAVCILVAWTFQIAAALGGVSHWWNWTNLVSSSVLLVSSAFRPSSPRVASTLFFTAVALSLLSIAGIVPSILR